MSLPTDSNERKEIPIMTGFLDYFPLAVAEVAKLSAAATAQHHPGQPMHWDRTKSQDHADCCIRHLMERGTLDEDEQLHSAKAAWRAMANLQIELEEKAMEAGDEVIGDQEAMMKTAYLQDNHSRIMRGLSKKTYNEWREMNDSI